MEKSNYSTREDNREGANVEGSNSSYDSPSRSFYSLNLSSRISSDYFTTDPSQDNYVDQSDSRYRLGDLQEDTEMADHSLQSGENSRLYKKLEPFKLERKCPHGYPKGDCILCNFYSNSPRNTKQSNYFSRN